MPPESNVSRHSVMQLTSIFRSEFRPVFNGIFLLTNELHLKHYRKFFRVSIS